MKSSDPKPGEYTIVNDSFYYLRRQATKQEIEKREAEFKTDVNCGLASKHISYAAFYGDAVHRITPVEAGTRITLSYQLFRETPSQGTIENVLTNTEKVLELNEIKDTNSDTYKDESTTPLVYMKTERAIIRAKAFYKEFSRAMKSKTFLPE